MDTLLEIFHWLCVAFTFWMFAVSLGRFCADNDEREERMVHKHLEDIARKNHSRFSDDGFPIPVIKEIPKDGGTN